MRLSHLLLIFLLITGAGCRAQAPSANNSQNPALERQIKLTIRAQYNVPPDYTISLGERTKSDISGYDSLPVTFTSAHGQKKTTPFLISKDNNTLARLEKFDITRDPATTISILGRPIRGNASAKVTLISFDDLECPFCARMHEVLFPATEQHYGGLVRFVYKDYPLPFHPWAMHGAVDVNCLAAQSSAGYWKLVDYVHAHADEISGDNSPQGKSNSFAKLDAATRDEGKLQNVNMDKLNACIAKQDESGVRDSIQEGNKLGVDGTPTLFINGERTTGALPQEMLWSVIDRALVDAGEVPPPHPQPAAKAPAQPAPAQSH